MKKQLNEASRIGHLPGFGDWTLPPGLSLFPETTCREAEQNTRHFLGGGSLSERDIIIVLMHIVYDEFPHEEGCPYFSPDKEDLLTRLREPLDLHPGQG